MDNNKLELIGLVLTFIGFLSFLSQKFFFVEALKNAYGLGDFLMVLGLILIFIVSRKKRKAEKEKIK
ncbi:hypothetical protein [Maribacter spongiicola]|uniref:hypothetical protein n=1 Tax=Maribacter spongiicola TaxID=1206753 RepID=UPI003F9C6058